MVRKLLTLFGVLFVLGIVGAAIAGLTVVKDRIRIVVQADEATPGPDPLALLRDDVQVLQRELSELRASLPGSFERLGSALEERAEARHGELRSEKSDGATVIAALRRELAGHGDQIAAMTRQLAAIDSRLDAAVAENPANASEPSEVIAPAIVEPPPLAAAEVVQEPVREPVREPLPDVEPAPQQQEAPKRKGFLSFSVPTSTFQFDQKQDYVLLPALCRVGFDAKSTLHDFTGVTSKVAGRFTADFDDPEGAWQGEVTCDATTLNTGLEGRDTNMLEHLDTTEHPTIRFLIERFEPGEVDTAKRTAAGVVVGRMTIRGKTQPVRMPIEVAVDASKRVVIAGQMPLKISDYGIPVPSQLGGAITMDDEVSMWIALRARAESRGGK